jgi:hypothetical protein
VQERIATSSKFLESKKDQEEEQEERRPTESRGTIHTHTHKHKHSLSVSVSLSLTLSNTYDTTEQQEGRKESSKDHRQKEEKIR